MTTVKAPSQEASPPADLAEHALLDIGRVIDVVCMSQSWVLAGVRNGTFPAPVVRSPRCTRWRAGDIKAYLMKLAENKDFKAAEAVVARAKKASAAAAKKRAQASQ